mmetsp:Transcript_21708/g.62267  ORF Transcript_21708/g.62267 Transcript_21708/m.62267 type:complete len:313 (-) Transcript_21708:184-1122(-)
MAPFMSSSLPLVTTALLSSSAPSNRPPCRRLEVCTSPGCVADGALGTLAKLRALAPPPPPPSSSDDASVDDSMSNGGATIIVKEGRCASACGSGPVVMETNGPIDRNEDGSDASTTADVRVVHKWIRDEALVKLLEGGGGGDDGGDGASISEDLIRGYDLYEQANDQVKLKRRHTAETAGLYQEAIDSAAEIVLSSMIALSDAEFTLPPNVEWVVDCYRQLATSKLAVFDRDGALEAAQRACEITRKNDVASLEVMAEVCKVRGDGEEELEALRRIFRLDEKNSDDEVPRDVALRRREQGFRLASLEKALGN